ncbi:MAG: heavy metal translocating P-type ATPase [Desulfovibrionaceae bacterium]|nr:heavy metal translocating P-type ATPase [Desulfovibrionaceae bacterium]
MQKFIVTGMSCAACSARVEQAVKQVPNVTSCSVSLLTNTLGVEGDVDAQTIIDAVVNAGYGAESLNAKGSNAPSSKSQYEALLEDVETPKLKLRLIVSLIILLPLIYVATGHIMWNWPLPAFFSQNYIGIGLLEMIMAFVVMLINRKFFINGLKGFLNNAPNMDTLVALGSAASFVWSTIVLFAMSRAQVDANLALVSAYGHDLYFESAAMIVTLITVGKMLEARSKGQTTNALKSLMRLAPQTAVIEKDGQEVEVPIGEVKMGDIFIVKPGAHIPVDGLVLEGVSSVNQAMLTGESIPVDKCVGDLVTAATINISGHLRCQAKRVGEDTTLAKIIQLVGDAQATKAPVAKIADKVSGIFVPVVIILALMAFAIWYLVDGDLGFALARGIAVLVISCPCALGLATPVAIMVGSGIGAKKGILFKTALALEQVGKIKTVALDKTGTITTGEPKVTDVMAMACVSEKELLSLAMSLESYSEHPLAKAVVKMGQEQGISSIKLTNFASLTGSGVSANLDGSVLRGGNWQYISQYVKDEGNALESGKRLADLGKTPLFFAKDEKLMGIIACADKIKDDSAKAVQELHDLGLEVVMLTGDNAATAKAMGQEAGVDEVISNVLPAEKEAVIRKLKEKGLVAMVGDGINDAPALSQADLGIAIGAGSDIAIDAAHIVLMKSNLLDVPAAIRLGRATLRNIHQNLFWAFCYNIIGIPVAAGLFYPLFGLKLSPILGALAMSLSSFCVVSNALRLNLFDPYRQDKASKNSNPRPSTPRLVTAQSAEVGPKYKLSIDGMMCSHCEGRVRDVLKAIPGVQVLAVQHTDNLALIETDANFQTLEDQISQAIVGAGYKYLGLCKEKAMEQDLKVEGMMCPHCEAHVKEALEKIPGVTKAQADHTKSLVHVELSQEVSEDDLKQAVVQAGYKYLGLA